MSEEEKKVEAPEQQGQEEGTAQPQQGKKGRYRKDKRTASYTASSHPAIDSLKLFDIILIINLSSDRVGAALTTLGILNLAPSPHSP